jgi:hypothetical protein
MDAIAYGLDYVRLNVGNMSGVDYVARTLPYLDVKARWYHGVLCVDMPGEDLQLVRIFDDLQEVVLHLAFVFPVTRIDVFIDCEGDSIPSIPKPGTCIENYGRTETVYSHHLASRGNHPIFARAYNAQSAGHYDTEATRFECEFKQEMSSAILNSDGWMVDPISVALWHIKDIYGVDIDIPNKVSVELNPPRRKYSHSRERFYKRYGKSIALDIESMGVQGLHKYIMECISNDNES